VAHQQQHEEIQMKSYNVNKKQLGFFDLGLSVLILALAGGSVYFTEKDADEKYAQQQEAAEVAVLEVDSLPAEQ